jgi:GT2 family glycosyltransferase
MGSVLEACPDVGAVSPIIRTYRDDGWDPSFLAFLSEEQKAALETSSVEDEVILTQKVPAPALLVRTVVLLQTGPFDPVYGSYYEDYDLCRRIRERGHRIGFCQTLIFRTFRAGVPPRKKRSEIGCEI